MHLFFKSQLIIMTASDLLYSLWILLNFTNFTWFELKMDNLKVKWINEKDPALSNQAAKGFSYPPVISKYGILKIRMIAWAFSRVWGTFYLGMCHYWLYDKSSGYSQSLYPTHYDCINKLCNSCYVCMWSC